MTYVVKRFLWLVPLLLIISFLTFLLTSVAPGNIAERLIMRNGGEPTPEAIDEVQSSLGLHQPLALRYFHWLKRALQLDLGISWTTGHPVTEELVNHLEPTLVLVGAALGVAILLTLLLGVITAYFHDSFLDRAVLGITLLSKCMPDFLLAFLLLFLFAHTWNVAPLMGYGSWRHAILPVAVLGIGLGMSTARLLRASLLEVLNQEFIIMAKAKGLSAGKVMFRHALPNALIPMVTSLGASIGFLLGGTVIIESIFNWPGLGRLSLQAVVNQDIPLIQGYVLIITIAVVVVNLLVDLAYLVIDPRVNTRGGAHYG